MKKFVVKNRQKRKYLKKSQKESLYSFSKTTYSMLPVLIMAIAFMATLVISSPLRDSLLHAKFSFKLPQFSFNNPLAFFLGLETAISQMFTLFTMATVSLVTIVGTFFTTSITFITHITITIHYPFITVNFDQLSTIATFITQMTLTILQNIITISLEIVSFAVSAYYFSAYINDTLNRLLIYFLDSIVQFITAETAILLPEITNFTLTAWQTIIQLSLYASHWVLWIAITVSTWLAIGFQIFLTAVTKALDEVISFVELPFKIIGHFFDIMKPYLMILGKHIGMAGMDFENGATSLGKAASYMSSSK